MARLIRLIELNVYPIAFMKMSTTRNETGMVMPMTTVLRILLRKASTTRRTARNP